MIKHGQQMRDFQHIKIIIIIIIIIILLLYYYYYLYIQRF